MNITLFLFQLNGWKKKKIHFLGDQHEVVVETETTMIIVKLNELTTLGDIYETISCLNTC